MGFISESDFRCAYSGDIKWHNWRVFYLPGHGAQIMWPLQALCERVTISNRVQSRYKHIFHFSKVSSASTQQTVFTKYALRFVANKRKENSAAAHTPRDLMLAIKKETGTYLIHSFIVASVQKWCETLSLRFPTARALHCHHNVGLVRIC